MDRTLASDFTSASFIVFGIIRGDIIYLLTAIFELNIIASILGDFFILLKYISAVYLLLQLYL